MRNATYWAIDFGPMEFDAVMFLTKRAAENFALKHGIRHEDIRKIRVSVLAGRGGAVSVSAPT